MDDKNTFTEKDNQQNTSKVDYQDKSLTRRQGFKVNDTTNFLKTDARRATLLE
jgi:catalase